MFSQWAASEEYRDHFKAGVYVCAVCGNELFESGSKFAHQSPWPSFSQTVRPDSVRKVREMPRALKVYCSKCNNGLGHEFLGEGPGGKSRFWIFSESMDFIPRKAKSSQAVSSGGGKPDPKAPDKRDSTSSTEWPGEKSKAKASGKAKPEAKPEATTKQSNSTAQAETWSKTKQSNDTAQAETWSKAKQSESTAQAKPSSKTKQSDDAAQAKAWSKTKQSDSTAQAKPWSKTKQPDGIAQAKPWSKTKQFDSSVKTKGQGKAEMSSTEPITGRSGQKPKIPSRSKSATLGK